MAKPAPPIPPGHQAVQPYVIVPDVRKAIAFYEKAFGAQEIVVMVAPDGKSVMHAEMKIKDSFVYLGEENPVWGAKSAKTIGASPVSLHLHVEDVDAVVQQAVAAGAKTVMPPMDMFWGDRYGKVEDPFGLQWGIATQKVIPTPEEMAKGAQEFFAQMQK
jgi:uncharacterized glyoxalase superfamily protein PhnB